MKKTIAAVLALMCVFGAGAVMPQYTQNTVSSVVALTAHAATVTEIVLPGINAGKYKYQYADTSVYTPTIKMVADTEWTDDNKNTYAIYEVTTKHNEMQKDDKGNEKIVSVTDFTEYHIGLKAINNNTHDVTANAPATIPETVQTGKKMTVMEAFEKATEKLNVTKEQKQRVDCRKSNFTCR